MTARTLSIQTRQLAGQDAVVRATNHHANLRRHDQLLQMTSADISPSKETDTTMDDAAIHVTSARRENVPEKDRWDEDLVCFCRAPEGFKGSLIACDGPCEEWYHNSCIDVTAAEAERIETFICPICARNGYGRTVWKEVIAGQSKIDDFEDSGKDDLALSGFPRLTAIERKREHKTLSLRAEGRVRSKTRRMKGWSEVCGVGMSGQMEPAR